MKILAFSDSHGRTEVMLSEARRHREGLDMIIHLGDFLRDADSLRDEFPYTAVCTVPGNCDIAFFCGDEVEKTVNLGDAKIFLCHGHSCAVKGNTNVLLAKAKKVGAAIALYGHTHIAKCEKRDGVLILNPGSISCPRNTEPPSYAKIIIENGNISSDILYV